MGLLSQGSPLNWEETKKHADHVRKHGILQFLNIYNKVKERQKDVLKWGDEVRLLLVFINACDGETRACVFTGSVQRCSGPNLDAACEQVHRSAHFVLCMLFYFVR